MGNPYLDRKNKHRIGKSGRKSEERLAKKHGVKGNPGSGSLEGCKGDVTLPEHLIEAKSTTADSFKVDLTHLAKISAEALAANKVPALSVRFITEDGRARRYGSWYMISESEFESYKAWSEEQQEDL